MISSRIQDEAILVRVKLTRLQKIVCLLCGTLFFLFSAAGFAQSLESAPAALRSNLNSSSLNPGLLTPLGAKLQTIQQPPDLFAPPASSDVTLQDEVHLEPSVAPALSAQPASRLWIQEIQIQGASLLNQQALNPLTQPYEGQFQTINSLGPLLTQITEYYRDKGYLTTEAYIPPQEVKDGVLTVQVQEGVVGSISLEGNRFYSARVINRYLSQKPGSLLNMKQLERDLKVINRFEDGIKVKAFLSPGQEAGQTNIKLKVAERQPWQISPTVDNQGRYFIGLYRAGLEVRNNSLLKQSDRLYARYLGAEGMQVAMASYNFPLNRFGTEISGNWAFSHVDVKLPVQNAPSITGRSYNGGVMLSQPLGANRNWQLDAGLNWQRSENFFEGDPANRTDVHSFQVGLNFDRYDRWGRTFNRVQNTVAFKGLGGSNSFWKAENYFYRVLALPKNNLLILKSYGQWTPDALPPIQQFQLGGYSSVRGFTEGVLIGDRGYNLGAEYRFPIPGLGRISPWVGQRVQGSLFYDFGQVWKDSSNPAYNPRTATLAKATLLQGVGFGFRTQLSRYLQGFVDVGFGLGNRKEIEPEGRQPTARVHFGIRSDFLPTDYKMRNNNMLPYKPPRLAKQMSPAVH